MRGEVRDAQLAKGLSCGGQVAQRPIGFFPKTDLAELRTENPVCIQMLDRHLNHLPGVEVAFRQNEGARGSRVHGGIAVGSNQPDQVEVLARAFQKGASFGIDDAHFGVFDQSSGEVGKFVMQQIDGHRVEFDPGDVVGVEVQGRHDFIASRGADNGDIRTRTEQAEGVLPVHAVVATERIQISIPGIEDGSERSIMDQEV